MMRKLIKYTMTTMIYRNVLMLLLVCFLSSCGLFDWDREPDWDYNYEVLYVNNTQHDIGLVFIFPEVSTGDEKKLISREHLVLAGETLDYSSDDFGGDIGDDPVSKYNNTTSYVKISLQIEGEEVKVWTKEAVNNLEIHSPYNPDSWKIFKDDKGWIKFTIEEPDLEN